MTHDLSDIKALTTNEDGLRGIGLVFMEGTAILRENGDLEVNTLPGKVLGVGRDLLQAMQDRLNELIKAEEMAARTALPTGWHYLGSDEPLVRVVSFDSEACIYGYFDSFKHEYASQTVPYTLITAIQTEVCRRQAYLSRTTPQETV